MSSLSTEIISKEKKQKPKKIKRKHVEEEPEPVPCPTETDVVKSSLSTEEPTKKKKKNKKTKKIDELEATRMKDSDHEPFVMTMEQVSRSMREVIRLSGGETITLAEIIDRVTTLIQTQHQPSSDLVLREDIQRMISDGGVKFWFEKASELIHLKWG